MHTNTRVENYTRVSCVDFAWKSAILHAIPVGQNLFRTSNLTGDHCQFCLGDVIRLQSQKGEVLRILIYTRLKINRK